jgi:hypothetical protein
MPVSMLKHTAWEYKMFKGPNKNKTEKIVFFLFNLVVQK